MASRDGTDEDGRETEYCLMKVWGEVSFVPDEVTVVW